MVDEAESCLHPKKQHELVRLLVRINNDGKNILMSTHSDSLASKVNNMILISNKYNSNKLDANAIRKLGLTEKDLFKTKNIKVYSFSDKGKYSEVNEIYFNEKIGFAFKQFEDSFNMLYEEAKIIFEE